MLEKAKLRWALILIAAIFLAHAGCATRGDVVEIVDSSKSKIVSAVLGNDLLGVNPAGGNSSIPGWKDSVAKIEEFIAHNPDEPQVVNALRTREAILLLSVGERNQGAAAFNEINPTYLSSELDKALFDIRETLIWWY